MTGKCLVTYPNNGKRIGILAGNSYMSRHANVIIKALLASKNGKEFGKFYVLSQASCPIFETAYPPFDFCPFKNRTLFSFVETVKPDVFITVNRLDNVDTTWANNLDNDTKTLQIKKDILDFSKFTKHFIHIQPHFTSGEDNPEIAANNLAYKLSINESPQNITRTRISVENEVISTWTKVKHAAKSCKNCKLIEILDLFCDSNVCKLYDPTTRYAYFCDGVHFTEYGVSFLFDRLKSEFDKLEF
uniref:SGNH domain-containing protein n=1 Tax=Panagrolaimus sp. JU765 TaxID=591449 RepID=A0AC34RN73_9BILA